MQPIYLDYNASTPLLEEVKKLMCKYIVELYGNPSSNHWYGKQTKSVIETAREQVANLIKCQSREIIFTSGGTESNNLAIRGIAAAYRSKGNHIITTSIEHPAVLNVCKFLETKGYDITYLSVDNHGIIDLQELQDAIKGTTILISIMHANNEVGTIEPLSKVAAICQDRNIYFHSDAAQSIGKIPVNVTELGVDLLSLAGHKLYAPQGVGALYVREGIKLEKIMFGADHEKGLRPGTENVIEIAGLGKACEIADRDLKLNETKYSKLTEQFLSILKKNFPDIKLIGHPHKRLPNTLNLSFPHLKADHLLTEINTIAASAGAACHSESVSISHVLQAMQVPEEQARGAVRFSVGVYTTEEEIKLATAEIINFLKKNIASQ